MLTKNQLKKLRSEIVLNSLFLKDYSNSLFIKEKTACDFFNSYIEYLYELSDENTQEKLDFYDILDRFDNIKNLWDYYFIFEDDPLLQDDFIAIKHLSNSFGIVIYNVNNDNSITCASYGLLGGNNQFTNDKITKNKVYYDSIGDPYIIKYRQRHYLKDFMKVGEK